MTYTFKFEKILNLKEREKEEVRESYRAAVEKFEDIAQKLYELLKKKEDLENFQTEKLVSGLSVQDIRHNQNFITNIEKTIEYYQGLVIQARNRMNWHEQKLSEMNVEVKKYEKIRENDFNRYKEFLHSTESKVLDELAVMQFTNKRN
ncbi:flagellar biosynthesis chaperone FliJ [Rossellomorea vietnamensis]|uniref:Flagellar FliJ protein n=2 Tax=Rossellomorea TaxID=2837508 RepID=A0A5D4KLA7_9BACI|nr:MULTISPECIES: flagellar export protein FliJ [Rossellomorea]TYR77525.1 flagellar biosynthesis chaperone FliJ [Rossellomorea vietnamensis]TYS82469.1 flagellar biosynthesis chaperone FliJ [Rossellomorea aquimaris]